LSWLGARNCQPPTANWGIQFVEFVGFIEFIGLVELVRFGIWSLKFGIWRLGARSCGMSGVCFRPLAQALQNPHPSKGCRANA